MVWVERDELEQALDPVQPRLRRRLRSLFFPEAFACAREMQAVSLAEMRALLSEEEGVLGAFPSLSVVGQRLIGPSLAHEVQRLGCEWLTLYPSVEVVERVAQLALDESAAPSIRDQAAWTLCFRQRQHRRMQVSWSEEAEAIADAALLVLLRRHGVGGFSQLAEGLRHVRCERVQRELASDPVANVGSVESFASEELATALLRNWDRLPPSDAYRVIPLLGHRLGGVAVAPLRRATKQSPAFLVRSAAAWTLLSLEQISMEEANEIVTAGQPFPRVAAARSEFFATHPGSFPTVTATQIARRSACFSPSDLRQLATAELTGFIEYASASPLEDQRLYSFLGHLLLHADDDALLLRALEHKDRRLGSWRALVPLVCRALAERGQFDKLRTLAIECDEVGTAAWELARRSRPFRALELLSAMPDSPDLLARGARALALFLAGRPDLADHVLQHPPAPAKVGPEPTATFPGPDEQYLLARPELAPVTLPALASRSMPALLALMRPNDPAAQPDRVDMALVQAEAERIQPSTEGRSVVLLGAAQRDESLKRLLSAQGFRILSGPFRAADYFIEGAGSNPEHVAQLRAAGVRPWVQ